MNKEDIKKALECCISKEYGMCKRCPNYDYKHEDCIDDVKRQALELITKQGRTIKNLNGLIDYADKEIRSLEIDKRELATALKQSEDNYSRAFERLKAQQREIEQLKAENKQAKIDVLMELKEKYGFYLCYSWNYDVKSLNEMVDEMIEEMKK